MQRMLVIGLVCMGMAKGAHARATEQDAAASTPVQPAKPSMPRIPSHVMAGLLLKKVDPDYPAMAHGASGVVELDIVVGKTGRVEHLKVVSGHPLLQRAATEAARQWTYKPYLLNGEPIEVQTTVFVDFGLHADRR